MRSVILYVHCCAGFNGASECLVLKLRQPRQKFNVPTSTRIVNRPINKAGLKACCPRRQTFLTPDHPCNHMQWATDKLCKNLRTWRHIYWSVENCFLVRSMDEHARVWLRHGHDQFQDDIVAKTEMFSGGSIMVCGCFSHDHKLDLLVVRQTLTGQSYTDDILQPTVPTFPFFRTTMPVHIGPLLLQNRFPREGLRNFSSPAGVPDMNPVQHCWNCIGRNINQRK